MNFEDGIWLNPPPEVEFSDTALALVTGENTDFWQHTHYGFRRDDGHFLAIPAPAEFDARLTFDAAFETLYDQAGIMLRHDAENWIKAGIELSDGLLNFSVVVTRDGQSDWSVQQLEETTGPFTIRLIRTGTAVIVHRQHGAGWRLMRLAAFTDGSAALGPTACTPERAGLRVTFSDLRIGTPPSDPLHLAEQV